MISFRGTICEYERNSLVFRGLFSFAVPRHDNVTGKMEELRSMQAQSKMMEEYIRAAAEAQPDEKAN